MRIPIKDFLDDDRKKLLVGQQVRINHDNCSAGVDTKERLYVKRTNDAILAYCHNCGGWGVAGVNKGFIKCIQELLEHEAPPKNERGELVLPDDIVKNPDAWPMQARNWVYQYGIGREEIIDNELCYSDSWGRVILPVYQDGKLVYWQGRAVGEKQDPKYISAKAHDKVMAWMHGSTWMSPSLLKSCVIVEDLLSAIKASRYVDSVALLGTSPDIDDLTKRLENYKSVGIFLDPDHAGQTKAIELEKRLSLVFRGKVKRIISHVHQPKEMDNSALAAIISGL